jgi:NIMA (never in mitosis gene a)-related kinase
VLNYYYAFPDLKPANIFLSDNRRVVKVGDLGHSRAMNSQSMRTYSTVGTFCYMSPEVIANNGYSFPSDVWSLGCILYELCTLEVPFSAADGNILQLSKMVNTGIYEPIPRYSATLSTFISLLLRYPSEERPEISDVAQIAHLALDACNRGVPVDDLRLLPYTASASSNL